MSENELSNNLMSHKKTRIRPLDMRAKMLQIAPFKVCVKCNRIRGCLGLNLSGGDFANASLTAESRIGPLDSVHNTNVLQSGAGCKMVGCGGETMGLRGLHKVAATACSC